MKQFIKQLILILPLVLITSCVEEPEVDIIENLLIYAEPSLESQLPISVYVDGTLAGTLQKAAVFEGEAPKLHAEDAITYAVDPGEHKLTFYQVIEEKGPGDNLTNSFVLYPPMTVSVREGVNTVIPLHP